MTPRYRTAFSVPSGFTASTPKITTTKVASKGSVVDQAGRRNGQAARTAKGKPVGGSKAA